jgi:hypothetical protein
MNSHLGLSLLRVVGKCCEAHTLSISMKPIRSSGLGAVVLRMLIMEMWERLTYVV